MPALPRPALPALSLAAAAAAAALAPAPEAAAFEVPRAGLTVTLTPAVTSDYLFRGISQTRNTWAVQGTLDVEHASGLYVGAFLSSAKFLADPWNDTRQELDLLAGYRFTLAGVKLDLGYIAYLYPGQSKAPGGQRNEYQEVMLRATREAGIAKLSAALAYSPNFFGRSGNALYLEGGVDVSLPLEVTVFGRLGHQWIERNAAFGTPDYLWYGIGLQREIVLGLTASVGWYGTDIRRRDCAPVALRAEGGQRLCDGRVVFTLSRTF
ncbi:TorF family putative porin [Crenalkalicoccus roseus]|uniref:TorF family putative porin n=1 Tax=Crenalkalicoccus roseus TaxID=1485588 RepID=UPI0010807FE1|nr:TorF family putative porin [Crenalkalicoccus roseus]